MTLVAAYWLVRAATEAPPSPTNSILVPLLVALIGGGGGGWLAMWYRMRQVGSQERDEIISRATKQVVEGAELLLQQYREDLAEARRAIAALQAQLEDAQASIAALERSLAEAQGDRDRLARDLADALERRGALRQELDTLRTRVRDLEALVGTKGSDRVD